MPRGKRVTKYINAGMKKTKGKKILTKEIVKNGVKYKYRYNIRTKEWSVKRTFVDTGYVPIKRKPTAIRIKPPLRRAAFKTKRNILMNRFFYLFENGSKRKRKKKIGTR